MIVITAVLTAKAGKEDELIEAMKGLVKKVRENEPGAIEYAFHRSQKDPSVFMVYERYQDGDAVKAHMTAPHFQAAAAKFGDLLDGGMGLETYQMII